MEESKIIQDTIQLGNDGLLTSVVLRENIAKLDTHRDNRFANLLRVYKKIFYISREMDYLENEVNQNKARIWSLESLKITLILEVIYKMELLREEFQNPE